MSATVKEAYSKTYTKEVDESKNDDAPCDGIPIRLVADSIEWSANGANNARNTHEAGLQRGRREQ